VPLSAAAETVSGGREPAPGQTDERSVQSYAKQEIQLAVVLNGGVSLAVWMSGVTLELHHMRYRSAHHWSTFRELLDVLGATARIDVIAGTSAGGLNGAFLALGKVHHRDLALMRDLWAKSGSL
jgi:predicted acylesterase/phospholipase RssA